MTTKTKTSPFATSFKSGINRGVPCSVVISNIAKRTGKTTSVIINSLCKAGVCCKQNFNGQCVVWPTFTKKCNSTCVKNAQVNMWQCFIDWCIISGVCTPEKLENNMTSQVNFMKFCRKFFNKQFTTTTGRVKSRKTTTTRNYKFTGSTGTKSRTTRRYRRAA